MTALRNGFTSLYVNSTQLEAWFGDVCKNSVVYKKHGYGDKLGD
jgi:hypothetical protein